MNSNVLDRNPTTGVNPNRLTPARGKCVVKRVMGAEKKGMLYLPEDARARKPLFEGTIVSISAEPGADYEKLNVGDHVYFSYQVGGDDSAFLSWEGEHYALIPAEAIQMVRL